jgi:predicted branched-subunit amino acid permease
MTYSIKILECTWEVKLQAYFMQKHNKNKDAATLEFLSDENYNIKASRKSNPSFIPQGYVDSYSTLPWVTWEMVTGVEGIPC